MAWDLVNTKSISGRKHGAIKKIYKKSDGAELWSAGAIVTYLVDTGVSYTEEVDNGASCLAPSSFTPTKSGWTFVGWREDSAADSSVLSSKLMGSDPIVLYAVFKKTVTAKFVSYNSTQTPTGTAYYNNTLVESAIITVPSGTTYSGWSWRGWSQWWDTAANGAVTYTAGNTISVAPDNDGITFYGLYQQDITVTYYNNSTSASTTTGTRYYNAAGNYKNPSFTLSQAAKSGMTARGWSTTNAGDATATYANNVAFTRDSNITLYGMYEQTITVTYYNNSTSASTSKGTRYWAPAGYINPSFKLAQASVSGWTARGWSTGTAGNSGVTYNNNTSFTRDSNCTLHGMYQKTVTLSYGGNGNTGGSTASDTATAYRNYAGTVIKASFTLKANGYSRTFYNFSKWDLGNAGASVTISDNKTAYAQWTLINGYVEFAADWASSDNITTTTYNVTQTNGHCSITQTRWGVESTRENNTYFCITISGATPYKSVTINWKQRDWGDYGTNHDMHMDCDAAWTDAGAKGRYSNNNYDQWVDYSYTKTLSGGATTIHVFCKVGEWDDWTAEGDDFRYAGLHYAITSVVFNA